MRRFIVLAALLLVFPIIASAQTISVVGVRLIKSFEGCALRAYKCPAGVWTIGYGNTSHAQKGKAITQDVAEAYLIEDSRRFTNYVNRTVSRELLQRELDALTDFCFNLGYRLQGDLLSNINRGSPRATEIMQKYNKARVNGVLKELRGLTRRRQAEASVYLSGDF